MPNVGGDTETTVGRSDPERKDGKMTIRPHLVLQFAIAAEGRIPAKCKNPQILDMY